MEGTHPKDLTAHFLAALSMFIGLCVWVFPDLYPASTVVMGVGMYTTAAVFSTALIAVLVTYPDNSLIRRLFQSNILAFFGKYSYSMYLLHLPIAMNLLDPLWHTRIRGWKMYLASMVLTYAITILGSLLTWHLLEKPMLNLKKYFEYKPSNISP
jgi:peptidoglycan/LPS O-acetylase OafA/YrhL